MTTREQKELAAANYHDIKVGNSVHSHYKAFIAGAEWAESKMKWIPVSERMPLSKTENSFISIDCLLFIKTEHSYYIRVGYHGVGWNVYGILDLKNEWVTHWMPLPELPAQEDVKPISEEIKQFSGSLNLIIPEGYEKEVEESLDFIKLWAIKKCGDCYYWMKSSECPAEKNIDGRNMGPSMSGLICEKFKQNPFMDLTKGGGNE